MMKLNGHNIITDKDITLSETGGVLHDKLQEIDQLKANIKYMYKHGTLGGNGSGGSGSDTTTSWKVFVRIDKTGGTNFELLNPNTKIVLSEPTLCNVKVSIYGGGTASFKITFEYEGSSVSTYANTSNDFTVVRGVNFKTQGSLNIIVQNQDTGEIYMTKSSSGQEIPYITFPYVTSSYKFEKPIFIKANDISTANINNGFYPYDDSIFMSEVSSTGLVLAIRYVISTEITEGSCNIEYKDWLGNQYHIPGADLNIASNSSGVIFLPLFGDNAFAEYSTKPIITADPIEYLSNNDNANIYNYTVDISITLQGNINPEEPIIFDEKYNLIPTSLYLKVINDTGTLFNDTDYDSADSTSSKMLIGDCVFFVTPYFGPYNKNRPYQLTVKLDDVTKENDELIYTEVLTQQYNPEDRFIKQINIPIGTDGVKRITFILNSSGTIYTKAYLFNVKDISSNFQWFSHKDFTYHASYKRNMNGEHDNENLLDSSDNELTMSSTIEMNPNIAPKTYTFDYTINDAPENFDNLFNIGIQYAKTNNTDVPIFSINAQPAQGQTVGANEIASGSIFVYQNKIIKTSSVSTIDTDDNTINVGTIEFDRELYVPLADKLESTNLDDFHLITIHRKFELRASGNVGTFKGMYAFIDGEYDSTWQNFDNSHTNYTSITFYPGNYIVNLLEVNEFEHTENSSQQTITNDEGEEESFYTYMLPVDIEKYYYTYYEKMIVRDDESKKLSENEAKLIEQFALFKQHEYTDNNKYISVIECSPGSATNIAKNINVPILEFNFTDNGNGIGVSQLTNNIDNVISWISTYYEQEQNPGTVDVTLKWSPGLHELTDVKINSSDTTPAIFGVEIQGSTTKALLCKNFELYAPKASTGKKYVYSPNIVTEDIGVSESTEAFNNMLLPEESFTLKGDVVDSSHTNNNAIGNFVNDNLTHFDNALLQSSHGSTPMKYIKKIRKCLTGFPILLFVHTIKTFDRFDSENKPIPLDPSAYIHKYYYFGVYNFNLGRNSAFNLGYNNLEPLVEKIQNTNKDGFTIYELDDNEIKRIPGLFVAEIQNNNKYFDFSQYHPSVLYKLPGSTTDTEYMWGDFIYGGTESSQQASLTKFVESIAKTGGYIFSMIGKEFSNDANGNYGYDDSYSGVDQNDTPKNQVPNFRYQAKRENNSVVFTKLPDAEIENSALASIFKQTLSTGVNESDIQNIPILSYTSVSEYYTTCMALGLVDSPEKNLNAKSWTTSNPESPGTFYIAFYDMDTGLGITNSGGRMNYFAFSDFWKSTLNDTDDDSNIKVLDNITIYRDYSPKITDMENAAFFDIPSSYLFAIAKYASQLPLVRDGADYAEGYEILNNNPATIWARWRCADGCLRNAKYFMDKYFTKHLKNIPISAKNWNYTYKYFVKYQRSSEQDWRYGFDSVNYVKFYGNKKAYTENWLDGRLHIMDAYMNLSNITEIINGQNNIYAPSPAQGAYKNDNPDVFIKNEIFSDATTPTLRYNSNLSQGDAIVTANPYSPLIIQTQSSNKRYLFPDTVVPCIIKFPDENNPQILYGGSKNWLSLSSIVPFITDDGKITIKSDYLTNIVGTSRKCTQWTFTTPALKEIELTSPDYSGSLTFNGKDKYPNLYKINISETALNLSVTGVNVNTLTANNLKSGSSIVCKEMTSLQNVNISGTLDSLDIMAWQQILSFPATDTEFRCKKMTIANNDFNNAEITITDNDLLTECKLVNYKSITITDCQNLSKLIINNDDQHPLTKLVVNLGTSQADATFMLGTDAVSGHLTNNVVDLSVYTSLTTLKINYANFETLILPKSDYDIQLGSSALAYNHEFKYIVGGENDAKLYINGSNTFRNCTQFTLLTAENVTTLANVFINPNCTTLAGTFRVDDTKVYGGLTYDVAKQFLDDRCTVSAVAKVKNISSMFYNQNIEYDINTAISEYNEKRCSLSLSNFANVTDFSAVFFFTPIKFYNRYMFKGLLQNYNTMTPENIVNEFENGNTPKVASLGFNSPLGYKKSISSIIYCTYDFLYEIIDKITTLHIRDWATDDTYLCIIDPDPEITSENPVDRRIENVQLSKLFNPQDDFNDNTSTVKHPKVLTTISGGIEFAYPSIVTYDLSNIFNDHTSLDANDESGKTWWCYAYYTGLTAASMFMRVTYKMPNYESLNYLFGHILIKSMTQFLTTVTFNDETGDGVDLYTIIDWDRLQDKHVTTNLFYNVNFASIRFKKFITYDNLHAIWDKLLQTTSLVGIAYLFYNCTITHTQQIPDFTLHSPIITTPNNKLTILYHVFNSANVLINGIESSLSLTWNTLKYLPNLQNVTALFANTTITYPVCFDFFHKRYMTEQSVFVKDENDEYIPATLYQAAYHNTSSGQIQGLSDMTYCFYNIRLKYPYAFRLNPMDNTYQTPDGVTYEYATTTDYDYNCGQVERNYIKDDNDNYYTTYYIKSSQTDTSVDPPTIIDVYTEYQLQQPSEITDIDKAINPAYTTYSPTIYCEPSDSKQIHNIPNFAEDAGTFISPDIFYGCRSGCPIIHCFGVNAVNIYTSDVYVFTGTIPEHLLESSGHIYNEVNLKTVSITNLFTGLKIKPILVYTCEVEDSTETDNNDNNGDDDETPIVPTTTHNYYVFVPSNFTNVASLANVFNFQLLLPNNVKNGTEVNHFYTFMSDSLSPNLSTLSESIPISTYNWTFTNQSESALGQTNINFSTNSYNSDTITPAYIRYNLMLTLIKDNDNNVFIHEGLDMSRYSKLMLDGLFNCNTNFILRILSGNLFKDGTFVSWNYKKISNKKFFITSTLTSAYTGMCARLRLIVPKNNKSTNRFMSITKSSGTSPYQINVGSFINSSDYNSTTYATQYPNVHFIIPN